MNTFTGFLSANAKQFRTRASENNRICFKDFMARANPNERACTRK